MPEADDSIPCSRFVTGSVFQFTGTTFETTKEDLSRLWSSAETGLAAISTSDCVALAKTAYCHLYHQVCTPSGSPRRICKSAVIEFLSEEWGCSATWAQIREFGLQKNLPSATNIIDAGLTNDAYMNHLAEWRGALAFPDGWYTEEHTGEMVPCIDPWAADGDFASEGGVMAVGCEVTKCAGPLVVRFLNVSDTPCTSDDNCSSSAHYTKCGVDAYENEVCVDPCSSGCALGCPYAFWDAGEWESVRLARLVPYMLSLPFSALVVFSEAVKFKFKRGGRKSSKGDPLIMGCGFLIFIYAALEGLPAAALGDDMYCDGMYYYEAGHNYRNLDRPVNPSNNFNGHAVCGVLMGNVHILQMVMIAVACTLYRLYRQLSSSLKMKKYTPPPFQMHLMFCVVVAPPLLCMMATHLLQQPQAWYDADSRLEVVDPRDGRVIESMSTAIRTRNAAFCGPEYFSIGLEVLFVHAPLCVAGFASAGLSVLLVLCVLEMTGGGGSKAKVGPDGAKKKQGGGKKKVSPQLYALTVNMLRFAAVCIVSILLYVVSVALLVPTLSAAEVLLIDWDICARSGVDPDCLREKGDVALCTSEFSPLREVNEARCGSWAEMAPSKVVSMLNGLALSLPCLLFGLFFSMNALKSLARRLGSSKLANMVASSSADTSSSSVSAGSD